MLVSGIFLYVALSLLSLELGSGGHARFRFDGRFLRFLLRGTRADYVLIYVYRRIEIGEYGRVRKGANKDCSHRDDGRRGLRTSSMITTVLDRVFVLISWKCRWRALLQLANDDRWVNDVIVCDGCCVCVCVFCLTQR